MIQWIDDVFRKVDQWSFETLDAPGQQPVTSMAPEKPQEKSPNLIRKELGPSLAQAPPVSPSSSSPSTPITRKPSRAYRERPEMLIPMESKWQKFLHSQGMQSVAPYTSDTKQLVLKGMGPHEYKFL